MRDLANAIPGYGTESARDYDAKSQLDKGDREAQRQLTLDLVQRFCPHPHKLLDLGTGTGFFAEALLGAAPEAELLAIDGSAEMLALAARRLRPLGTVQLCQSRLEALDWPSLGAGFDVIFSALAIHHLEHSHKWQLFRAVAQALKPSGIFILIDQFLADSPAEMELLEYLACKDMQRRIFAELALDEPVEELELANLIAHDRMLRSHEGDKDAPLAEQLAQLRNVGFTWVTQFMQQTRYFGVVAQRGPGAQP